MNLSIKCGDPFPKSLMIFPSAEKNDNEDFCPAKHAGLNIHIHLYSLQGPIKITA